MCSSLSTFHNQIASPFSPPTKVTAKNMFLLRNSDEYYYT